jgi:luciferase family oxidoreductase group 1
MWILGITHRGARLAAEHGTAFTYGHFITPGNGVRALDYYYTHFQTSPFLQKPKTNVCVFVVCAKTQEEAEELALSQDLWLLGVERGIDTRIPSVEEAKKISLTAEERMKLQQNRRRMIIGTPQKVKTELNRLSEIYQSDEFMIITNIYDFQAKMNSYILIANELI